MNNNEKHVIKVVRNAMKHERKTGQDEMLKDICDVYQFDPIKVKELIWKKKRINGYQEN